MTIYIPYVSNPGKRIVFYNWIGLYGKNGPNGKLYTLSEKPAVTWTVEKNSGGVHMGTVILARR